MKRAVLRSNITLVLRERTGDSRAGQVGCRLEIRGTAKGQRRLIDLKPAEIRSVKLEIIYNRDRSQVIDSDQK